MMHLPTLSLAILVAASVSYAKPPQAIVGGTLAADGEFPYIVSISRQGRHFCGGSIITDRHILTAAHCVAKLSTAQQAAIRVRAGSTHRNYGGKIYAAEKVKFHENFDAYIQAPQYDVAIITLNEKIEFTDSIKKIDLVDAEPSSGADVTAIGWGLQSANSVFPPTALHKVALKSYNVNTCKKYLPNLITNGQLCSFSAVGQGICMGDSGGPLEFNGKLAGLVSFGIPCAVGYPDVLTSVYHYKSWINDVISK